MAASFLQNFMIYLKIVKQYKHVHMAINDCSETASETCFQGEKSVYAYHGQKIPEKILQIPHALILVYMEKISLKFDNLAYSTNYAKS